MTFPRARRLVEGREQLPVCPLHRWLITSRSYDGGWVLDLEDPFVTNVYLIDDGRSYKVGKADDPAKRLSGLQCGTSVPLTMIAHRPAPQWGEGALHEALRPYHLRGEWFRREPVVVDLFHRENFGITAESVSAICAAATRHREEWEWCHGLNKQHLFHKTMGRSACGRAERYEDDGFDQPLCLRCKQEAFTTVREVARWAEAVVARARMTDLHTVVRTLLTLGPPPIPDDLRADLMRMLSIDEARPSNEWFQKLPEVTAAMVRRSEAPVAANVLRDPASPCTVVRDAVSGRKDGTG